jgi:hypothetical protein
MDRAPRCIASDFIGVGYVNNESLEILRTEKKNSEGIA